MIYAAHGEKFRFFLMVSLLAHFLALAGLHVLGAFNAMSGIMIDGKQGVMVSLVAPGETRNNAAKNTAALKSDTALGKRSNAEATVA